MGQSLAEICKSVMLKNNVHVELSTNKRSGTLTLIVTGDLEHVQRSKRDLLSQLTVPVIPHAPHYFQVTETLAIPASCRPFLIGKGGSHLKSLTARTFTKINVPRQEQGSQEEGSKEEEQLVTIVGDAAGVAQAKQEILDLVIAKVRISNSLKKTQQTSTLHLKMSIDRTFHPFILPHAQAIESETTGVRIHIPPTYSEQQAGASEKTRDLNEIAIHGDRVLVQETETKLAALYQDLVRLYCAHI